MQKKSRVQVGQVVGGIALLCCCLVTISASTKHLTLVDSSPKQDEVLAEAPTQILLRFNEVLDLAQCGISLRGSDGAIDLGELTLPDSVSVSAPVTGSMADGEYRVSWIASAKDDHAVRGRYSFTVSEGY